jgi:hypothetical protein
MKPISTSIADVTILEEGIILIQFTKDAELDEPCAIEILHAILNLTAGKPHTLLYDLNTKSVLFSNIAKKLASLRNQKESKLMARAFLTSTLQNDMEAGHFIHYSKPESETRIFHIREEALAWLRKCLSTTRSDLAGRLPE